MTEKQAEQMNEYLKAIMLELDRMKGHLQTISESLDNSRELKNLRDAISGILPG
jgi:Ni,Fe-hydrogenase III large subunit